MNSHIFSKEEVLNRLENARNKTLEQIDNKGIFKQFESATLQKGIAGTIVEQCIFGYEPDCEQKPDLVIDGVQTELKTTGVIISSENKYIAKEPVSITAVSVYEISDQTFENSYFWHKLEHILFVYYHHLAGRAGRIPPSAYKDFPIKGYQFYEFSDEEKKALREDWQNVHDLVADITNGIEGVHDRNWEQAVKNEYINRHGEIRAKGLNFIDLAPKFPPRFRLKANFVSTIIDKNFGDNLEQLPGKYETISDIRFKLKELELINKGKTLDEIAKYYGMEIGSNPSKSIAESVLIKMFGGTARKLNDIEIFKKLGVIAKTLVLTSSGRSSEATKMFQVDFDDFRETQIEELDEQNNINIRMKGFEDSQFYNYFTSSKFIFIVFQEPTPKYEIDPISGKKKKINVPLKENRFLGFKEIYFDDEIINNELKKLWIDTCDKIQNKKLVDEVTIKNGRPLIISNGEVSTSPNFMRASENDIFIKGGGQNGASKNKTECVNGIKMLKQFVWLRPAFTSELVKELTNAEGEKAIVAKNDVYKSHGPFGCCSRYLECSREGKCIHPNLEYAKDCYYRKNLERGKIFY